MSIQQSPEYHEGFFDASGGTPLFEGECSPNYKAGWIAYYECRAILSPAFEGVSTELQKRFPEHYARADL